MYRTMSRRVNSEYGDFFNTKIRHAMSGATCDLLLPFCASIILVFSSLFYLVTFFLTSFSPQLDKAAPSRYFNVSDTIVILLCLLFLLRCVARDRYNGKLLCVIREFLTI